MDIHHRSVTWNKFTAFAYFDHVHDKIALIVLLIGDTSGISDNTEIDSSAQLTAV